MPPTAVKTVRDLIYWQYSKIISESAGIGKHNYSFVMNRFRQLQQGDLYWNLIREYVTEKRDECIFCGARGQLTMDHLFPRALRGPEDEKNIVWVCTNCNASKGAKRLYQWWASKGGLKSAKYDVPRVAEGKYLKLLYETLDAKGLLDLDVNKLRADICPTCDLKGLCEAEESRGELSPLCLDGVATLCFNGAKN